MKGKVVILAALFVVALLLGWITIPMANAEKMTLRLIDWHEPRMILYEKKTKEYEQVNPDIKFETTLIPWGEFWQKALAGAAAGKPVGDVMQFHNASTSIFMGLLEPYPEDLFPLDKMREEFFTFDQAYVFDGEFYYYPGGVMSSLLFYNKKMWDESGIGEFPKTWEDLRAVAKKLTKYSEIGEIDIAGLAFNGYGGLLWDDFNYQMGGWHYNEDGTGVEWDTEGGRKAITFIWELMFKDKVNSPGFLDWMEAFGTEKSAMVYGWTWFRGWMDVTYPDVEYIVSVLPTPDGDMCPAAARNNYECELAIPKATPEDKKKEGFKFIKWAFEDDQFFIDMNLALARVPGRLSLWDDPQITGDKVVGVLAKQVPYTIFPGEWPDRAGSDPLTRMEDAIRNEMDPLEALKMAEEDANMALADKPVDWVVERQYSPPCE